MQTVFAYSSIAVVVRHWFEVGPADEEHGCRVELRTIPRLVHRGTESASQMLVTDRPLWRADLFDVIGAEPGNCLRAHYHPAFEYSEPSDREWEDELAANPIGWLIDRLKDLTGTLDGSADLDLDVDQQAVLHDLDKIIYIVSARMGRNCPSPQACLSQTSDVRYIVPAMFAELRSAASGIDPRADVSTWDDVVARRDLS